MYDRLTTYNMKTALISILLLSVLAIFTPKAYADCQPIYGGGQTCTSFNFTINKLVKVPNANNYVDNLSINDPRYSPSQTINYELIVTNTGDETIPTLSIKDNFPSYVNFVSGAGSYDANSKTLSFTINNLGAGKSQTFILSAKTSDSKTVPAGITCVVNNVTAIDSNNTTDTDSAQACIQNSTAVLPAATVKTTPPTGPEMLPLALLFPGALGGLFLRRKSKSVK
jgi:uncharacterized repeat protein (TIGR01451 family)